ncbi:uncharacterized protein [Diadema antillarum]|uniref:uncharacterized protein n=1 Tax=Diadema antillarum TaxID=105358 RepID=UPI003A8C2C6B
MSLKAHFSTDQRDKENDNANTSSPLTYPGTQDNTNTFIPPKPANMWSPPITNPHLSVYLSNIQSEMEDNAKSYNSSRHIDNLTKDEREALKALKSKKDIIIKPADKGSAVVIMSTNDYIAEGDRQLSNSTTYKKLPADPTPQHLQKVKDAVQSLDVDSDTKRYLVPKNPVCPSLYFLPKIHKQNNPGRPIVSGCSCPTVEISRFLDFHLRPLAQRLPSYLKDTTHFLNHILDINTHHTPFSSRTLLVTADVTSLYTNIPHQEGMQACKEALNTRTNTHPPTDQLLRLLHLVLTLNNFSFNGEHYLQIQGTAMGTPVAPTYANIFMGKVEHAILSLTNPPLLKTSWRRYIDDIFFLWNGSPRSLASLQEKMNNIHPTIKFTFDSSPEQTHFLDVTIKHADSQLHTELYTKPTDTHTYLLPTSCHPAHSFKGIVYSQALRVTRICSNTESLEHHLQQLAQHFIQRGYNKQMVHNQITRARHTPRDELLSYRKGGDTHKQDIFFPITYSPATAKLPHITHKHHQTLQQSDNTRELFPKPPTISFRRGRTIRDLLVRAKDPSPSTPSHKPNGFYRCNSRKCNLHQHIVETTTFQSTTTGVQAWEDLLLVTCSPVLPVSGSSSRRLNRKPHWLPRREVGEEGGWAP